MDQKIWVVNKIISHPIQAPSKSECQEDGIIVFWTQRLQYCITQGLSILSESLLFINPQFLKLYPFAKLQASLE